MIHASIRRSPSPREMELELIPIEIAETPSPDPAYVEELVRKVMAGLLDFSIPVSEVTKWDRSVWQLPNISLLVKIVQDGSASMSGELLDRIVEYSASAGAILCELMAEVVHRCLVDQRDLHLITKLISINRSDKVISNCVLSIIRAIILIVAKDEQGGLIELLLDREIIALVPEDLIDCAIQRIDWAGLLDEIDTMPFGIWLGEYLKSVASKAMTSVRGSLEHRSMEQIVIRAIRHGNVAVIDWLFKVADHYYGCLFRGNPDDAARSPLWQRGHLTQLILDHNPTDRLLEWIIERVLPSYPGQWREIVKSLETDSAIDVVNLALQGRIVMNGMGLFRETCGGGVAHPSFIKIDPSSCSYVRDSCDRFVRDIVDQYMDERSVERIFDYCTTMPCPCARLCHPGSTNPELVPFHAGPLPFQKDRHSLLYKLALRARKSIDQTRATISVVGVIATYTRTHNMPVFYYLVDDLVLLVRNPCHDSSESSYDLLELRESNKHTICLRFEYSGTEIMAISLIPQVITLAQAIAACRNVMAKSAKS